MCFTLVAGTVIPFTIVKGNNHVQHVVVFSRGPGYVFWFFETPSCADLKFYGNTFVSIWDFIVQLPFLQPFARIAEALAESRYSGGAVGVQKDGYNYWSNNKYLLVITTNYDNYYGNYANHIWYKYPHNYGNYDGNYGNNQQIWGFCWCWISWGIMEICNI